MLTVWRSETCCSINDSSLSLTFMDGRQEQASLAENVKTQGGGTPASFPSLHARSGLTPRRRPALFAALDGSLRPPRPPSEPEFLSSLKLSAEKNFPERCEKSVFQNFNGKRDLMNLLSHPFLKEFDV